MPSRRSDTPVELVVDLVVDCFKLPIQSLELLVDDCGLTIDLLDDRP